MIFVDGPDGVGKTGYSQWLARELGWPRLEMRPVEDTDCIEEKSAVFNAVVRDLHDHGIRAVIDRGSVSSIVYSRIFDRGEPTHAWDTLDHVKPTLIYLSCDPDELVVRYGNNDEIYSATEIREIAIEYEDVMMELHDVLNLDVVTVDTSSGALERLESVAEKIATDGL